MAAEDKPWAEEPCSFAFVAADGPGAWGLACTTGIQPAYAEGRPAAADLTVTADASELDLLLWGRRPVTDLRLDLAGHSKHVAHLRSYLDLS